MPTQVFVLVCILLCIGCDRVVSESDETTEVGDDLVVSDLVESLTNATLETEADVQTVVDNTAGSERAIMFVHVDWAFMHQQQERFAQFMTEYQRTHAEHPIMFHYVDCTSVTGEYAPLRSLPGWRELHDAAGTSLIHGWGELVWMKSGRVLHVERILNCDSVSELVRKTESLMCANDDG